MQKKLEYPPWGSIKLGRGRVCGGWVGQEPSWLGDEFVRGRDVQFPFI